HVGANSPGCVYTSIPRLFFQFTSGPSYTVTLTTTRSNQFSYPETRYEADETPGLFFLSSQWNYMPLIWTYPDRFYSEGSATIALPTVYGTEHATPENLW